MAAGAEGRRWARAERGRAGWGCSPSQIPALLTKSWRERWSKWHKENTGWHMVPALYSSFIIFVVLKLWLIL